MKLFEVGLDETTLAFLRSMGFSTVTDEVTDADDLKDYLTFETYDAVVINLDVVNWGTFAVRYLRSKNIEVPIIALTCVSSDESWSELRAQFLENGGNDLLRNPANPRELSASIRAIARLLRGAVLHDLCKLRIGDVEVRVNLAFQSVTVNGKQPRFTSLERRIVMFLAARRGHIVSRKEIHEELYTVLDDETESNTIEVFVTRIRKKLRELHPDADKILETVRGAGYRISDESDTAAAKVA